MRGVVVWLVLTCAAIGPLAIGCSPVPIEQAAPLVDRLTMDDDHTGQLKAGRAIYVTRCALLPPSQACLCLRRRAMDE